MVFGNLFKRKEDRINAEIKKFLAEHKNYINKINNLLPSYKDVSYNLFYNILIRFFRKVYDLPASESHHHSDRFGLFIHSLETCINALIAQHRKLELKFDANGDLDSQFNLKNKERILYRTAIQGLLHDAGKIFDINVISKKKEIQWDNYDDNLLDFYLEHGDYIIRWNKERAGKHQKRNIIILWQMLETKDREYLTTYNFIRLIDEFWGYDPIETTKEIIKDADIASVKMDYQEALPKKNKKDEIIDLIDAFTASVNEMVNKRILKINDKISDLFVLDTTTLIVNPSGMEKILAYMRKHYRLKTTREHITQIMREKKIILETNDGKTFIHAFITPPGAEKNYKMNFVIIKNKFIWGYNKPENYKGKVEIPDLENEEKEINAILEKQEQNNEINNDQTVKAQEVNTISERQEETQVEEQQEDNEQNNEINNDQTVEAQEVNAMSERQKEKQKENNEKNNKINNFQAVKAKIIPSNKMISKYKKYNEFLKALAITLNSGKELNHIEEVSIAGKKYIVVGYYEGFREIFEHTGIVNLEISQYEQIKAINGFVNSLYHAGHLARFKEFEEKPLITIQAKKYYEKAILIYKESLAKFIQQEVE
jgi:hypothetical protein